MQILHKSKVLVFCFSIFLNYLGFSQEIEPRRWSSLPIGTNVIGAGYAHTFGDIFLDPLLQAEDVSVNVNAFILCETI
jgi:hypothetical protein